MKRRYWVYLAIGAVVVAGIVAALCYIGGDQSTTAVSRVNAIAGLTAALAACILAGLTAEYVISTREMVAAMRDERRDFNERDAAARAAEARAAFWIVNGEHARIRAVADVWNRMDLVASAKLGNIRARDCRIQDWYTFASKVQLLGNRSAILATCAVDVSTRLYDLVANLERSASMAANLSPTALSSEKWEQLRPTEAAIKQQATELALILADVVGQAANANEPLKPDVDLDRGTEPCRGPPCGAMDAIYPWRRGGGTTPRVSYSGVSVER